MKKYILMLAGAAFLIGKPMFADEMKMDKATMSHDAAMCEKHCNIMELGKKVKALKAQAASADKTTTIEHLKKDIERYEKELEKDKADLENMK